MVFSAVVFLKNITICKNTTPIKNDLTLYYASQKLAAHDWLIFFVNENQKNAGARRNLWVEVRYVQ